MLRLILGLAIFAATLALTIFPSLGCDGGHGGARFVLDHAPCDVLLLRN